MSDHMANVDVKMGSERNFGLVFAAVFALIALWPLLSGGTARWLVLAIAAAFACLALVSPTLLRVPNRLWFKLGMLLGAIVAPVVMGLVFLVTFVPIGLILRAAGKDLLAQQLDPAAESYWIERAEKPNSMKLQY